MGRNLVTLGNNSEKSFNNRSGTCDFQATRRCKKIDKKITALTLLLITAFAAVVGGLIATTNIANATENSTTSDNTTNADQNNNIPELSFGGMKGMTMGEQGFGGGPGYGRGPRARGGFMDGMGNIEASSEYTSNVNAILGNDSDVQNLISQGYNVTAINPIVKNIIQADGTLSTKATTAMVTLQNGTSGFATVSVDISQAKVTQIVIITRTVIDKTTS